MLFFLLFKNYNKGDPTIHGNLPFPKQFKEAIIENIETGGCAGYGPGKENHSLNNKKNNTYNK